MTLLLTRLVIKFHDNGWYFDFSLPQKSVNSENFLIIIMISTVGATLYSQKLKDLNQMVANFPNQLREQNIFFSGLKPIKVVVELHEAIF